MINKVNKRYILNFGILLILFLIVIGCSDKKQLEDESLADIIYENKTDYVGNNGKVLSIIENLEFPDGYKYDHIEILSDEEPYELNIYFNGELEGLEEPYNEVVIILSLIKNLEKLNIINENNEAVYNFEKSKIKEDVDLDKMYQDKEYFKEFIDDYQIINK